MPFSSNSLARQAMLYNSAMIERSMAGRSSKVAELKSRGQIRRKLLEVREDQASPDSLPLFFRNLQPTRTWIFR